MDDPGPTPIPEDLVPAGDYPTRREGFEHGLVILAMGESYWLVPADPGYRLLVDPHVLEPARDQLARFDRESLGWPPAEVTDVPRLHGIELFTPLLWALAVLAVFWAQTHAPGRWEQAGELDPVAIFRRGEWWRLGTALFLHADLEHMISNVLSGIFVFAAVLTTLGRARGWLLLAGAALAGNFAVAVVHRSVAYHSLGASTAIFAGLGLLTGRAIRVAGRQPRRWLGPFAPLWAGISLLALYGAGGLEVDVLAHLTGFLAGVGLGFAFAYSSSSSPKPSRLFGSFWGRNQK